MTLVNKIVRIGIEEIVREMTVYEKHSHIGYIDTLLMEHQYTNM